MNTFVQAENAKMLANLIEGDMAKMYVQVTGAHSYATHIGGRIGRHVQ